MHPAPDLAAINERLERATPLEVLVWAHETFGDGLVMTSSFQSQSVPLLHLLSRAAPSVPVLFLDTGFHFHETLAFRDRLADEFELEVRNLRNEHGHAGFLERYGELHRIDPDHCCYLNKVAPLQHALKGASAWITGIRRDQTSHRADTPIVDLVDGRYKVCPLATWTERDVWSYMGRHDLPEHPLLKEGYPSVGCAPCTRPVAQGEDARAGRWSGAGKTECGLHLPGRDLS